jgi:hypothetical protein
VDVVTGVVVAVATDAAAGFGFSSPHPAATARQARRTDARRIDRFYHRRGGAVP